jgi:hypothetical protein
MGTRLSIAFSHHRFSPKGPTLWQTLGDYVAALAQADIIPRPDGEEWKAHVERISVPGRIAVVTEEDYFYWLEVLPPKYQRRSHFCFGEGADAFRLFWHDRPIDRYLCRQLTWDETLAFCRLAGISTPW